MRASDLPAELRHGWREFSSRSWHGRDRRSAAVSNAIFFPAFQVLGPTVAHESLGGSSSWALIAAMWGAGGLLGGVLALDVRPRRPLLVSEGFILLFALPVMLLAIPASTVAIALGALFAGATVGLAEILYETSPPSTSRPRRSPAWSPTTGSARSRWSRSASLLIGPIAAGDRDLHHALARRRGDHRLPGRRPPRPQRAAAGIRGPTQPARCRRRARSKPATDGAPVEVLPL